MPGAPSTLAARPLEALALSTADLGRAYEASLGRPARKQGGVYYTPAVVVEHGVEQALGRLLRGLSPQQARRLTILDPACGAGAFLVGAYHALLRWGQARAGAPLGLAERLGILTGQIHGVDSDPRAVELTRLALLLQALQGEEGLVTRQVVEDTLAALATTIQRGDSLLAPIGRGAGRVDPDAFDWSAAFPAIMGRGGFDAVIGNPPYLSFAGRQTVALPPATRRQIIQPGAGWPAAHALFVERAVRTLSRRVVGFVVPAQMGRLAGYQSARDTVADASRLVEARYWGEDIFRDAVTPILTFITDRRHAGDSLVIHEDGERQRARFGLGHSWHVSSASALIERVAACSESLGALVADPGVHTGNCGRRLIVPAGDAPARTVPVLEGRQVRRYACAPPTRALRLDVAPAPGEYFTIRPAARYEAAGFVIRQTAAYPIVGPRRHATYFRNSLLALYAPTSGPSIEYLAGLLNSTLLRVIYAEQTPESRQRAFPQVKVMSLRRLPIRRLDFTRPADVAGHASISGLVEELLSLHATVAERATAGDRAAIQRQIEATDRTLDQLVYALYDLTERERALVERLALKRR